MKSNHFSFYFHFPGAVVSKIYHFSVVYCFRYDCVLLNLGEPEHQCADEHFDQILKGTTVREG